MQPGDLIADRFEIEHLAGSGGMGAVYRARDRVSAEPVALKTLFGQGAQDAERFSRESVLLAELRHPGIVRYISHGITGAGVRYLVMEWLDGIDLADYLSAHGALPIDDAVAVVRRVGEALSAAHHRGIVHRDIKPSNIFLASGTPETVRVLDFGIARVGNQAVSTRTGMVVGTPGYMAPEQARGERQLDARADVFSLGCVLFECLTGRAAFVGEHIMALLAKILIEEAPRPSSLRAGVSLAIDRLVGRMLSKDREARPRDGAALVAEIDALGASGSTLRIDRGTLTPASSLTTGEQRLLCVVTAGHAAREGTSAATAPTMTPEEEGYGRDALRQLVGSFGGRLEPLAGGSHIVILTGRGSATDQAAQAAKCALAMRALLPEVALSLATGRGTLAERWPVGEVIERAVKLLRVAEKAAGSPDADVRGIRIDDVTAGLLDVRFEVRGDDNGLVLSGEREIGEGARTLLGAATPCVGREVELRTLEAVFAECTSEPLARAVLVTAAAGVGKSRLRHEFIERLSRGDCSVDIWIARGDPMSAGSPFGLIAQAIRRAAGLRDGEAKSVRQQKLRARVARHVAATDIARVSEFLGELTGVQFPDAESVQLRAARQDAVLMGDQMLRAWEDFLAAECAAQPVVLVLEDLHWGDLPTVKFIDAALRNLQDLPFMVLALARPEVHEQFPKLWAGRALTQMQLGELSRKAGEKLVRHVLGKEAAPELVARVLERAAGNAFYLEELIRAVAAGKGDALPETVLAMVQARLETLDAEARRVLRAASVFGQVFWRRGVLALLGPGGAADLDAWVNDLVDRELVMRRGEAKFPGEEELVFRHALVREAAYGMLTDADRAVGHLLAGGWLESAGEGEPIVLAEHFERGGEPLRALAWFQRAAEQALEGNDFTAAIERAGRGIACGAEGEIRATLLLIQARAHSWSGDLARDEACALEAMECARRGSAGWCEAAGFAALAAGRLGNMARLVDVAERLLQVCSTNMEGPHVIAAGRTVRRLLLAGKYELAETLLARIEERGAELAERDPAVAASLHQVRALHATSTGDTGAYLELTEALAVDLDRMGNLRLLCEVRTNLGHALGAMGRYALAERTLRDAATAAGRIGLPGAVAHATQNLGLVLGREGKLEEARAMESASLETWRTLKNPRMEGASRMYLATIVELSGDLEVAEREARAAVEALAAVPPLRCYALAILAQVLLHRGRFREALAEAEDSMRLLEQLGQIEEGEASVRLIHAEAHHELGDVETAKSAIRAARDRLLARSAKIRDSEWRRCFLENVQENARTLTLAAAWTA